MGAQLVLANDSHFRVQLAIDNSSMDHLYLPQQFHT